MAYLPLLSLGALDAAGYSVIAPVVPAIARATGAGPGVMGALVATFGVGMVLSFVPAGREIQRRGASFVLAVSVGLLALGSVGLVFVESLPVYFVARLLMGIGSGGLWLGCTFGILERFPDEAYRRLTGLLAVYSVGGLFGPALGAIGGIRGPFLAYLGLVGAAAAVAFLMGAPQDRPAFGSDRAVLRAPGFLLASTAVLMSALALGTLDGPLPLHFAERLSQSEIGALYVATSFVVGMSAVAAGRFRPRPMLMAGTVLVVAGIALAGTGVSVPLWIVALGVFAVGFGLTNAGALGALLETIGTERIVLAMVVWSQIWGIGYLLGPAASGGVAEGLGFEAIGLVPLVPGLAIGLFFLWTPRQRERPERLPG